MAIIANVWENLYYGIIGKKQLPAGYRTIKTWNIGEKIISGQLHNFNYNNAVLIQTRNLHHI